MRVIRFALAAGFCAFAACSNLPPEESVPFKAYPNPYNPTAGVLTIEKLTGAFGVADQHDLVVLEYNLNEVYRATVPLNGTKLIWAGIDSSGAKVAPGIYYIKVIITKTSGTEGADAMFKLVVQ